MNTTPDTLQKDLFEAPSIDHNVEWLENLLAGAGAWMTAKDISLTVGGGNVIDRNIREYASASANILSGQRGYLHIKHASAEEINHACAWLESQAKKMGERAGRIRSNAHRIFG